MTKRKRPVQPVARSVTRSLAIIIAVVMVAAPAPERITTTEPIPQPRQEGFQPPPSDVVGISKPEREPRH